MTESQETRVTAGTTGQGGPTRRNEKVAQRVIEAIDDGLVEALGPDLALAVRVCMSTSLALSDPLAYASALDVIVGNAKSELVLDRVGRRLRGLESELKPTNWGSFAESILALRSRYSLEIIRDSK